MELSRIDYIALNGGDGEHYTSDWLECEEFYNLMQAYRHAPIQDQSLTVSAYENVKDWIRMNQPVSDLNSST